MCQKKFSHENYQLREPNTKIPHHRNFRATTDSRGRSIGVFLWNAVEVEIPLILWARTGTPTSLLSPTSWISSRRKKEIPFFDIKARGRTRRNKKMSRADGKRSPLTDMQPQGSDRGQQQNSIQDCGEIQEGLNQERVRKGIRRRPSLS